MFHIVVVLLALTTGKPLAPPLIVQEPSFQDKVACDAERTGASFTSALDDLKKALVEKDQELKGVEFELKSVCYEFKVKGEQSI